MARDLEAPLEVEDGVTPASIADEGVRLSEETATALRRLTSGAEDGVAENPIETEALRRAHILLGDRCLEKTSGPVYRNNVNGLLDQAFMEYAAAGATEKLAVVGDGYLALDLHDDARKAYAAAGETKKLVMLGERYLAEGAFSDARKAYELAGVEISREQLVACGDRSLATKKSLVTRRGGLVARGELDDVLDAYTAAGATKKLVAVGKHLP